MVLYFLHNASVISFYIVLILSILIQENPSEFQSLLSENSHIYMMCELHVRETLHVDSNNLYY